MLEGLFEMVNFLKCESDSFDLIRFSILIVFARLNDGELVFFVFPNTMATFTSSAKADKTSFG